MRNVTEGTFRRLISKLADTVPRLRWRGAASAGASVGAWTALWRSTCRARPGAVGSDRARPGRRASARSRRAGRGGRPVPASSGAGSAPVRRPTGRGSLQSAARRRTSRPAPPGRPGGPHASLAQNIAELVAVGSVVGSHRRCTGGLGHPPGGAGAGRLASCAGGSLVPPPGVAVGDIVTRMPPPSLPIRL